MLALAVYRSTRCPTCGGPMDECGPKTRGQWMAPPPRRCSRIDAILLTQSARNDERTAALSWKAERKT